MASSSTGPERLSSGPQRYDLACRVDAYRSGWTLIEFLTARFRYHDRDRWLSRIAEGAVRVNGVVATSDTRVAAGDDVGYVFVHTEPDVDPRHSVLYADDDLLAVAKSGNLPVHAGGQYIRHTLTALLRESHPGPIHLAHRLDRETSGVVLVARSKEMARELDRSFQTGRVQKRYLAIVYGETPSAFVAKGAIGRREPRRHPYFRVVTEGGKAAETRFVRLAVTRVAFLPGGPDVLSLVAAMPITGRTHQIRVHLAHAGHPVVGDKLYAPVATDLARDGLTPQPTPLTVPSRHLLHCHRLEFPHPRTNTPLTIEAPPPQDFHTTWPTPLPHLCP